MFRATEWAFNGRNREIVTQEFFAYRTDTIGNIYKQNYPNLWKAEKIICFACMSACRIILL